MPCQYSTRIFAVRSGILSTLPQSKCRIKRINFGGVGHIPNVIDTEFDHANILPFEHWWVLEHG